jgi:hypothetical protein
MGKMVRKLATSEEISALSQPSRQGDEIKILSGGHGGVLI